ncbi:MAG TPA: BNR-4 repeat-containing protein [Chitinivibrionales bacterium]|nr:BNR-4 repeat-containing protein [Chitinivibrionales bacterium]
MPARKSVIAIAVLIALIAVFSHAQSIPKAGADFTSATDNGAWTWYGNPVAVYHEGTYKKTYMGWISNAGVVSVATYDHTTGAMVTHVMGSMAADDHSHPSLLIRPDGRLMVFFSGHDGATMNLYISTNPEDISAFDPLIKVAPGVTYCYPNPMWLSDEGDSGRIYLFYRSMGLKPCFSTSDDWGKTWTPTKNYYTNPDSTPKSYANYCCNGKDEIDIVIEKGHRAGYWPLYYLKYKNGAFWKVNGTKLATMDQLPVINTELDTVMDPQAAGCHGSAWDIALDNSGLPVIAYDQFKDANNHVYYYVRWTGTTWFKKQLVNSGADMGAEDGFAGGITLDHENTGNIYMSRQINGMHEIDKWSTPDGGTNWDSTAITRGSANKNTRPIVPRYHIPYDKIDVVWMYGSYSAFTGDGYNTAVKMYPYNETVEAGVPAKPSAVGNELDLRATRYGITFNLVRPQASSLKVYKLNGGLLSDLTGVVGAMNAGPVSIPYSSMGCKSGVYLVAASSGGKTSFQRIIVSQR